MFVAVFNGFVKACIRSGRVRTRSTWFDNSGKISLVTPESTRKTVSSRIEKREETKTSSLNVNMIKGKWHS